MAVETKHAARRKLCFTSLAEVLADAERLAEAEASGEMCLTGNWTLGQIFGHLATWIDYGFDGAPMRVPWFVRWIMRLRGKRAFIEKPMPAGVHIPGVKNGTLAFQECSTQEGLAMLRRSIERLEREGPERPHPLFGNMTQPEWHKLHLRHAELHLSFCDCRR